MCERTFTAMGTEATLIIDTARCDDAERTVRGIYERVTRAMSPWIETSDVSRINRGGGKPVVIGDETFSLLERAVLGSRRTDGLFDVTFASLGEVWSFKETVVPRLPDPSALRARLALVDYRKVTLDAEAKTVSLGDPRVRVSLNGIAKGYAVDAAAAALRASGARDFLLRLGGDLYAAGTRGARPWKVAIRDPRALDRTFAELDVRDAAFSTSGDYERFFMSGGKRYHHIIDPRTGYPATASRSVTMLCKDATSAEVLSKAIFIAGHTALDRLLADSGCDAVIVDQAGLVHTSRGVQGKLVMLGAPAR
ncbi:MAG: FAD:protein FMN transferase [Deltaproteobacteria bacterium]|nr:FAD:protein FMN transferase [Deltaproteobacteria bacterium]